VVQDDAMTLTVLVPEEEGLAALAELDNVFPVVYNPAGRMPEEAGEAEIIVVPPLHADRLVAAMRDMPKLRLVQTLSAGIDQWEGRLRPARLGRRRQPDRRLRGRQGAPEPGVWVT
jgi:phosphoglycerate dehydrogenase-like enzyme